MKKAIFTFGNTYEIAELTIRNMIQAYKLGAVPAPCLISTALSTWTDDFLFENLPELRPKEVIKNENVRKFIERECPDLSEEEVNFYFDSEMEYRNRSETRRGYVIDMYRSKYGIRIIKALHPEWIESINAYIYAQED